MLKRTYLNISILCVKHYSWINVASFILIYYLIQNLGEIALCEPNRPWIGKSPLEIMNEDLGTLPERKIIITFKGELFLKESEPDGTIRYTPITQSPVSKEMVEYIPPTRVYEQIHIEPTLKKEPSTVISGIRVPLVMIPKIVVIQPTPINVSLDNIESDIVVKVIRLLKRITLFNIGIIIAWFLYKVLYTKPLKAYFYRTIGLLFLSWTFYRILIFIRETYVINSLISWYTITIIFFILLTHIIINARVLITLISRQELPINKLLSFLINHLYNIPLTDVAHKWLKSSSNRALLHHLVEVLNISIFTIKPIYLITFILEFLPRIELIISLYLDVFILNKICTFPQTCWIMIIPLSFRAIIYLMKTFIDQELTFMENQNHPHLNYYLKAQDILLSFHYCKRTFPYLMISFILGLLFIYAWGMLLLKVLAHKLVLILGVICKLP